MKVWDAATGKLRCVDARISPPEKGPKSELTSFCPGTGGRKIITGEAKGGIKVARVASTSRQAPSLFLGRALRVGGEAQDIDVVF